MSFTVVDIKDRIPTDPGRRRLVPVVGDSELFDVTREDNPTEPGTSLGKSLLQPFANTIKDVSDPIALTSGVSTSITLVKVGDSDKFTIEVPTEISGASLTMNINGEGSKPVQLYDGTVVDKLEPGFHNFVEKPTVFIYAPSGRGAIAELEDPTTAYSPDELAISTVTRETVTSSGWVMCIFSDTGDSNFASLLIDGSYLLGSATDSVRIGSGGNQQEPISLIARFETSFELKTQVDDYTLIYLDGDKFEEAVVNTLTTNAGGTVITRESYLGEGWVTSLLSPSNPRLTQVRIDGGAIVRFDLNVTIPYLAKFNTSLELRTDTDQVGITYIKN